MSKKCILAHSNNNSRGALAIPKIVCMVPSSFSLLAPIFFYSVEHTSKLSRGSQGTWHENDQDPISTPRSVALTGPFPQLQFCRPSFCSFANVIHFPSSYGRRTRNFFCFTQFFFSSVPGVFSRPAKFARHFHNLWEGEGPVLVLRESGWLRCFSARI